MKKQLMVSIAVLFAASSLICATRNKRVASQLGTQVAAEVADAAAVVQDALNEVAQKREVSVSVTAEPESAAQLPTKLRTSHKDETTEKNRKRVVAFVEDAISYFQNHTMEESFRAFMHDSRFEKQGEYIFVFDDKAILLAKGGKPLQTWRDEYDLADRYGNLISRNIVKVGVDGGGWVHYQIRNADKLVYARAVKKGDKNYIIGSGFHPHSIQDEVVGLVDGAVDFFNVETAKNAKPFEIFADFSYPLGKFVRGSLYLYALDFKGRLLAQGDEPGLIGQSAWNYRDARGKLVNQEIIKQLKAAPYNKGIWVEYYSKNALKRAYARKVRDAQGVDYAIACGYYPDADREQVQRLVALGYRYIKSQGVTLAAEQFNAVQNRKFYYGDLGLFLCDMKGKVIAYGGNSSLVGNNFYDEQDEDGVYYVREMIKKAQEEEGAGWLNFRFKNAYYSAYVERVKLGTADLVISSGVYAASREETMVLLVKSAIERLKKASLEDSFGLFMDEKGPFVRGELGLFVIDETGMCYVYMDQLNYLRKNIADLKDDHGKAYVKDWITAAQRDEGKVSYTLYGLRRIAYVEKIEKDGRTYIVGSSLYE